MMAVITTGCLKQDICFKITIMQLTETSPQQAEHFEWINAVDFYHAYLDIVADRIEALADLDGEVIDERKVEYFSEKLNELRERLYGISYAVSEHIDEMDLVPAVVNRLERDLQSIHHCGIRDKIEMFEEQVNDFRTAFNEFYVRIL
jgi:hypothetical protein